MKKQSNIIFWDVICYIAFPLLVWNFMREPIGDYYAILLASVPGIIYSFIRFFKIGKIQFFGLFMLGSLVLSTLVDILSGSALQLLWNRVYFSFFVALFFLGSMLIRRPIALFLALDVMEMQGSNRKKLKTQFYQKKVFSVFQVITFLFVFREVFFAFWKVLLIKEHGVEAFDQALVLRQALSWAITFVSAIGFLYVGKLLSDQKKQTPTLI